MIEKKLFRNFSETNPNSKEPKVGDWGWFWDNETERSAIYGELLEINKDKRLIYKSERGFKINFSHEKPNFLK